MNEEIQELIDLYTPLDGSDEYLRELYRKLSEVRVIRQCPLIIVKGWNVDHIKPQIFGGTNDLDNLNPSCKDCNNYKCHTDLEGYRNQLHKMLNEKLEYLFKSKTKMQVAMNMGSIKHTFWDGKFHFERVGSS